MNMKMSEKLDHFSNENLSRFEKFIGHLLNQRELQGNSHLLGIEISKKELEHEGFGDTERKWIITSLNEVLDEQIIKERGEEFSLRRRGTNNGVHDAYFGISERNQDVAIFDLAQGGPKTLNWVRDFIVKRLHQNAHGNETTYLITKKGEDFYYKNKPIQFGNTGTAYHSLFATLYEDSDRNNGFCSYTKINKGIERRITNGKLLPLSARSDSKKIKERVANALKDLRRYTDGTLPLKAPDGKSIIKTKRGGGLIFYNPEL